MLDVVLVVGVVIVIVIVIVCIVFVRYQCPAVRRGPGMHSVVAQTMH